jgi:hypothetical protein
MLGSGQTEKGETGELTSRGIVNKEFLKAGQTVNPACYCDVLWQLHENVRRLRPKLF